MDISDLRIALFSGNYNMTVDGANKALNRLVGYLLAQGAAVRVYSPTVDDPAFAPTGELGRASCRERVCQVVSVAVVALSLQQETHRLKHRVILFQDQYTRLFMQAPDDTFIYS